MFLWEEEKFPCSFVLDKNHEHRRKSPIAIFREKEYTFLSEEVALQPFFFIFSATQEKEILKSERLSSLDAFRGLTIAGMILVNNPGSWTHVYAPLRHADWHGWTPTDLVFPFFLFIVGVSISFSFSRRLEQSMEKPGLYSKLFKRTLILFALGIFLTLIPRFNFATLRIPGVLQRIALCYLFASLLFLKTGTKWRSITVVFILAVYWLTMKLVPVPGFGPGILEYEGNLCAFIDSKLLAGHLYKPGFDPEGILSTLPAVATTLLGTLTGDWLRSSKSVLQKTAGLFIGGIVLIVSGLLLHPLFPINKQLWTSTYVIFSAGAALLVLGICYWLIEGMLLKKWAVPFLIFGTNAIAVYVGSSLMAKLTGLIRISSEGSVLSFKTLVYTHLLVPWAGNLNGSLVYPLILILIWIGITLPLYRKKIFIKI
jgi:predicted acyltransferase